jgi:hypothetical protein
MRTRATLATDSLTYYEILNRAEKSLAEGNFEGVRIQAIRAFDMVPSIDKVKNRFYDAALRSGT